MMFPVLEFLLKALARLPFWILYGMADVLFLLIYYIARYRRKLVRKNLAACFPDKSANELRKIERKFYRNFADYIVETIKLLHISDEQMLRRMEFEGLDVVRELMDNGRSIVAYFSHCGNWEWAPSITLHCPKEIADGDAFCQIYRPLRNERFDALMLRIRSRFGSISIPKRTTLRRLLELKREGRVSITGFMSDQKPSHGDAVHIIEFLGRPTAVITGTEQLANRLKMAAVYWDMSKPRRGHYRITVRLMTENAAEVPPMQLTDSYFRMLEETIRRQPSIWLWTHNRWKNSPAYETK